MVAEEAIRKIQSLRRTLCPISGSEMERSPKEATRGGWSLENEGSFLLTVNKEVVISVPQPQELDSAHNLNKLGSTSFPRGSTI